MTVTDILSLSPLIIIAIAPVVIMLVISVIRNYDVVYGFSVLALLISFASVFLIIPLTPHSIKPLFIVDIYSRFFLELLFFQRCW